MKINPVAIQNYQQIPRRENPTAPQADGANSATVDQRLVIEPQTESTTSRLAVKAPDGNYADFLTLEERKALELLFSRFKYGARAGAVAETPANDAALGRLIDVKV